MVGDQFEQYTQAFDLGERTAPGIEARLGLEAPALQPIPAVLDWSPRRKAAVSANVVARQ
ncbi:hypothetical protein D3C83_179330 [compost metagenome]